MGHPPLKPIIRLALLAAMVLPMVGSACNPTPARETVAPSSFHPTDSPFLFTPTLTPTFLPTLTRAASPAPTHPPQPAPSPDSSRATLQPLTISAATAASLVQTGQISFTPWDMILALAWSPDGKRIACAAGEVVTLYSPTLEELRRFRVGVWTTSLAFDPQSRLLAAGGKDGTIRVWDIEQGELVAEISAHQKGVNALTFSPDSDLLASAGNDGYARLWEPHTTKKQIDLIGGTYAVPSIAFVHRGRSLAIANGAVIRLRDVESGRFVTTYRTQESSYSLAVSPNGELLAVGTSANRIYLWQLTGEDEPLILSPPNAPPALVWSLSFSPDGSLMVSGGSDHILRLWDVNKGALLAAYSAHQGAITSLAFRPDGCCLLSGGLDGVLRFWTVR